MSSLAPVAKVVLATAALLCAAFLPPAALAGSLRVGPTRLELSARRPVVVLEVQNTGGTATLAQLDAFAWRQEGAGDLLEPTTDVIATPVVMELAPGETRLVRVGLRQSNSSDFERSYRLFVREVPPAEEPGAHLRFAVRIGVPVFALPLEGRAVGADLRVRSDARSGSEMGDLGWRWGVGDIPNCAGVELINPSVRHERVLVAEMLSAVGEVLWRSSEPVYVLARSRRLVPPELCPPSIKEAALLRLTLESRTLNLPVEAQSLIVDAKPR